MAYLRTAEAKYTNIFCALVCRLDGVVLLSNQDLRMLVGEADVKQTWIRVDRYKRQWYQVNGSNFDGIKKVPSGITRLAQALESR